MDSYFDAVKSFLCLITNNARKKLEVKLQAILTSTLNRDEYLGSRLCRFIPGEKPLVNTGQEAGGSKGWAGRFGESRMSYPTTKQNTIPQSSNP
jgi:hypothetical protein